MKKTIMFFGAHADDMEIRAAGTMRTAIRGGRKRNGEYRMLNKPRSKWQGGSHKDTNRDQERGKESRMLK